jgi:hypothetical protein
MYIFYFEKFIVKINSKSYKILKLKKLLNKIFLLKIMNDLENEIEARTRFFEAIKALAYNEIINIFRNPNLNPWTYLEDDEYSGKCKILHFR